MINALGEKTVTDVCKIGEGKDCCRFLVAGHNGLECAKGTEFENIINARRGEMTAQGDNCDGPKAL